MISPLVHSARAHAHGVAAFLAGRPEGDVRVAYGVDVPHDDRPAVGGIVKLQHLAAIYPPDSRRFNLLYLITSRLPMASAVLADWARRKGARLVVNQNGVAYPAWYGAGYERANREMAQLLARADHVFYQSEFCRMSADRFVGQPRGTSEILYNAVDTARFTPGPKPTGRRELTLLLAGSQDQWYRFEAAVRTLAEVVRQGIDAELIVTGRLGWIPPTAARIQADALVRSANVVDRVELTGPYAQRDAPALFRRADIVLHTKYNDPCPTAVIEALACGRPVVYSKSGGVPELVGDDAGAGVDAELSWERDIAPDPQALAAEVLRVRAALPQYQSAARARAVARFDVEPWLTRHREVFEQLVAE
jgi:glycosyltransferase involved in cell wall biosynthesis